MIAIVWFDKRDADIADEEGIGKFPAGGNEISDSQAREIIKKYDRALRHKNYRAKRNRLLAQRNSIATAFGPEFIESIGGFAV